MKNAHNVRFLIRNANLDDLEPLYQLSLSNGLLNLPANRELLYEKINISMDAFSGSKDGTGRQFIFVLEDQETGNVTGTSTIFSDYADKDHPLYSFSVYDSGHPAPDVEVPSGHQLLRMNSDPRPISALGGLVVDSRYRGLPEKRGKQISLIRFVILGMYPELFHTRILSELMAPTDPDGSNPFWKAIGQRYTGVDYEQVLQWARLKDRSFIQECFPKEDILLSPDQAHLHRGCHSVQGSGRAQQHMITSQGFCYLHQVDPMDGGLQYAAGVEDVQSVQNGGTYYCDLLPDWESAARSALIGVLSEDGGFLGGQLPVSLQDDTVQLPRYFMDTAQLSPGDRVYAIPM